MDANLLGSEPSTLRQFSQRLRYLREEQDKGTQEETADWLGISLATYGKWERGETLPSLDKLLEVANRYDTSVDFLLGRTQIPNVPARIEYVDSDIKWRIGAVPLSEEIKTAVALFADIVSLVKNDWRSLLDKDEYSALEDESSAVKLLERAIESRWVEIEGLPYSSRLQKKLRERFHDLSDARVVELGARFDGFPEFKKILIAQATADYLVGQIKRGKEVAFSGGGTMLLVARFLRPQANLLDLAFFPLDINPVPTQPDLNAASIISIAKMRLGGSAEVWQYPFREDFDLKKLSMLSMEGFRIYDRARKCKYALVGIGNPWAEGSSSNEKIGWILAPGEHRDDAVADILFHLIDERGEPVEGDYNSRIPSIPLDDLRATARSGLVIGAATGDKAIAVDAILLGRYVSSIVLDDTLASGVLSLKKEPMAKKHSL